MDRHTRSARGKSVNSSGRSRAWTVRWRRLRPRLRWRSAMTRNGAGGDRNSAAGRVRRALPHHVLPRFLAAMRAVGVSVDEAEIDVRAKLVLQVLAIVAAEVAGE